MWELLHLWRSKVEGHARERYWRRESGGEENTLGSELATARTGYRKLLC